MDLIGNLKDGSLSPPDSPTGSPALDDNDVVEVEMSKPDKPFASAVKSQKHKSISDMVHNESELIWVTQIKFAEVQAKEKTACEKVKWQALAEVELEHIWFQWDEGQKQHAHEVMMMDWQIELERFKAIAAGRIGPPIPDTNIDPALCG
jgi:hypothetical protein